MRKDPIQDCNIHIATEDLTECLRSLAELRRFYPNDLLGETLEDRAERSGSRLPIHEVLWIADRILDGGQIAEDEALAVLHAPDSDVPHLLSAAWKLRSHHFGNKVKLNYLVNAKSGLCPEDCTYCTQSKDSTAEIEQYLQKPIAVRVGLQERMPHLNIAPDEARVLTLHLSTVMLDDALEPDVPSDPETVARGRELFDRHGCLGCHIVGERGGFVGPELNGSGERLQPGWTVEWLLDPEGWKPGTLQPDHGLTREEAEALTAYTLSLPARKGRGAQ